jgi:DNA-binding NarL/FixJ family response regulator
MVPACMPGTGGAMNPMTVMIVDDNEMFREGIRDLLGTEDDLKLVGESKTGEEACDLAGSLQPDVILMDIKLEKSAMDGIEATRRIIRESPHIAVLVVTMYEDDSLVFNAMRQGARGYVVKGGSGDEMLRAIRTIATGGAIFSSAIARRFTNYFNQLLAAGVPQQFIFPELTSREREVLDLLARGLSNKEIAAELVISPITARNHVSNILCKLQIADRTKASVYAREAGFGHVK